MTRAAQHLTTSIHWQPVGGLNGVWELRRTHGILPLRATAVRLADDRVCVYSPVPRAGSAALEELRNLGEPILLAPNAYHTLGLREHASAFEKAAIVTSDRAFGRIKNKTKLSVLDLRLLEANLPSHIWLLQSPDLRNGEVWLSIRDGNRCAWVAGDAFLNFSRLPATAVGLGLKLLRMGPDLAISTTFELLVKDRRAYRDWVLAKLAEDKPTILIPCHGDVLIDDALSSRIERLVRRRL